MGEAKELQQWRDAIGSRVLYTYRRYDAHYGQVPFDDESWFLMATVREVSPKGRVRLSYSENHEGLVRWFNPRHIVLVEVLP